MKRNKRKSRFFWLIFLWLWLKSEGVDHVESLTGSRCPLVIFQTSIYHMFDEAILSCAGY